MEKLPDRLRKTRKRERDRSKRVRETRKCDRVCCNQEDVCCNQEDVCCNQENVCCKRVRKTRKHEDNTTKQARETRKCDRVCCNQEDVCCNQEDVCCKRCVKHGNAIASATNFRAIATNAWENTDMKEAIPNLAIPLVPWLGSSSSAASLEKLWLLELPVEAGASGWGVPKFQLGN
jgi:hypothetical protein